MVRTTTITHAQQQVLREEDTLAVNTAVCVTWIKAVANLLKMELITILPWNKINKRYPLSVLALRNIFPIVRGLHVLDFPVTKVTCCYEYVSVVVRRTLLST